MANAQAAIGNEVAEIGNLVLESGKTLTDVHIAYQRKGAADAPAILVCHALTGNQYTMTTEIGPGWWEGLIGPGQYIDSEKYQVITTNVLGGCEGTTGPLSINPLTGRDIAGIFRSLPSETWLMLKNDCLKFFTFIPLTQSSVDRLAGCRLWNGACSTLILWTV